MKKFSVCSLGSSLAIGIVCGLSLSLDAATKPAMAGDGSVMYVTPEDSKIHTAGGAQIVIRGFNQIHLWGNQDQNFDAIQDVSKTGANTVRVVFGTDLYGIRTPDRETVVRQYIVGQNVNVIVEDHSATCQQDTQSLVTIVDRWLTPANVSWLTDPVLQKRIILNIANEWSGDGTNYVPAYQDAIARIRAAGIKVPLMIDAGGCGQDMASITNGWKAIFDSDPLRNVIFDIHMYGGWSTDGSPYTFDVQAEMDRAIALRIPLIVGEFGYNDGTTGLHYDTRLLMKILNDRNIGWTAWSWNDNGDHAYNMIAGTGWRLSQGLSPWGQLVIKDAKYGLKAPLASTSTSPRPR